MDISVKSPPNSQNIGPLSRACHYLVSLPKIMKDQVANFALALKKIGQEDPRRIVHAFKVGLAITIVSLFYYFQPLYNGFGVSAMWAVLTVVVIFEFTVGATLGKGLNRMIATCIAGYLGVSVHHLADLSGKTGEPILLGLFGFLVAGIMTFLRFIPKVKARYDYGFTIFILTFSLVSVSGYRDDEAMKIAHQRLSTIIIGCCIAMLICICICPVWSGAELQNLISSHLDKLGDFLEGFGGEYFQSIEGKSKEEKPFRHQYKSVLGSKSTEETMANLASWEPSHGRFRFRHPWKQYLKIGTLTRQCAYRVDVLNNYLNSNVQMPLEIQENIKEACTKISSEMGKSLKELAMEMKKMRRTSTAKTHLIKSKAGAQGLKSLLKVSSLWEKFNLLEVLPAATVASILIDIVNCVENISEGVNELGSMAGFKSMDRVVGPEQGLSDRMTSELSDHHLVIIKDDAVVTQDSIPHKGTSLSVDSATKTTSH